MKLEKEFTLLKIESKERKTKEGETSVYLIISVLDEELNPCKFFVFNKKVIDEIFEDVQKSKAMSKVLITLNFSYDKVWNCNVEKVLFDY